jgi:hypothetical protein
MRKDLAQDNMAVPAFDDVLEYEQYVGEHYISADELVDARLEGNTHDSDDPRYNYARLRLRDSRLLYFIGVDLDFEEITE